MLENKLLGLLSVDEAHLSALRAAGIEPRVVILATGGTIAGTAHGIDPFHYQAGQVPVEELVTAARLEGVLIETEQVAQLDSKDMDYATWRELAMRAAHHLARPEVVGVVVTHGTDTLDETEYFLHRVLDTRGKLLPVTAAMRPATALSADGPQNLHDAVMLARYGGGTGVCAVLHGKVHHPLGLRKTHTYDLNAFESDGGPIAFIEGHMLRRFRPWAENPQPLGLNVISRPAEQWPWVEMITNACDSDGRVVHAMLEHGGLRGIVVAGTGNGTVSKRLTDALKEAQAQDVRVVIASRCSNGRVIGEEGSFAPMSDVLGAPQARVDLLLELLLAA